MVNVEIDFLSFKHMVQVCLCVFGFVLKTIRMEIGILAKIQLFEYLTFKPWFQSIESYFEKFVLCFRSAFVLV